ncbi:putative aldouronate transport system permease protein [Paenibacillus sp. UNCCL117]|uniref:carbohydrate ABC transporter permease n=1 Tax=unclassified Paenibacillus TaxID=185978 RepID=UPI0008901504|nr:MULTISPECIES: carbohydrate ABC transporter permease [unclassified Paenibacillus]SDC96360.1 putative aldouronate transport system permease protein [Paenibacillus sp. cl123]SFW30286.1 putative aldouronate transport system permease protein [Paenibacillus sp. UNCCL117]
MVRGAEDRLINSIVVLILSICGAVAVFPMLYVVSISLTPIGEVLRSGGFPIIPREVTFEAYERLLKESGMLRAFGVTVFVTVVGTTLNLLFTVLMAYPLSRKWLPGRSFFLMMVLVTILFSGGLIPTYLTVKAVGLLDSVWALILPSLIGSFYVLIVKSFFEQLPEELFESARIDGAQEGRILLQLAIPLSLPVMATIGLFYAVGHWNEFFQAIMYVTDRRLFPLQVIVREILMQSQQPLENAENVMPTQTLQMAAVVLASMPVIVVYPFLQKYFTKGMLLGSIKG